MKTVQRSGYSSPFLWSRSREPRSRVRLCLEYLESRTLPSTLFLDTFNTNPPANHVGWYDINHGYNSARQSGLLAPLPYLEQDVTAAGGAYDNLTQVNNTALPNTLLLATRESVGQYSTWVSPEQDFGAPGLTMAHLHVAINPLGPGSAAAGDHWAGVVFGTTPGDTPDGGGTGVLLRPTGDYEVWDDGGLVGSGNIGAKTHPSQFYAVDFAVTASTGDFTLFINGVPVFSGNHGAAYTTNYVTLEDYSDPSTRGTQFDYFDNLSITGTALPIPLVARPNTTYYVSPEGSDKNAGTSQLAPWQTITRVNHVDFRPGDRILFQGGATFPGNLEFDTQDIGLVTAPITVGSYGTGRATINAGAGIGIDVVNASYFTINNLTLVGSGYATNNGDGIRFVSNVLGGSIDGINVDNVDVAGFGHVGIHFLGLNNSGDFTNVNVYSASSHDNGMGGVGVDGQGNGGNIYIGHVTAYHNAGTGYVESGYGILVIGCTDVVIERCLAYDNGWLPGNNGATGGIEAIGDSLALVQYNESYGNLPGQSDGDGVILDDTFNSIMQYNYSHDNGGAGLFLFAEDAQTCVNNVVRYNISQNDARTQGTDYSGLFIGQAVSNADIYGNTVFMSPSANSTPSAVKLWMLAGTSVAIRNNIFVATGGDPVVSWDGIGSPPLFQGNDYWSGSAAAVNFLWGATTYAGLGGAHGWRAQTSEETLSGAPVGFEVDPKLVNPGGGGIVGNPDTLFNLSAYQLQSSSPIQHSGLDLSQFGIAWDAFDYAADDFLSGNFDTAPLDFYGTPLPTGSELLSIGAYQAM
jgi:hypothetical protein